MQIVFYEKPGCSGNAKQKKLLDLHQVTYKTKDILTEPWSFERLSAFFDALPKEQIYNPFAPQIKQKALDVDALTKEQLIKAMLQEPILIKRPLLEIDEHKICGFDIEQINKLLGKNICESVSVSTCQSESCG